MIKYQQELCSSNVELPTTIQYDARLAKANDCTDIGEVAEWSNAAVLKTVDGLNRPGVRIPPSPPLRDNRAVHS